VSLLKSPFFVCAVSLWAFLFFGIFIVTIIHQTFRWVCFVRNENLESIRCHKRYHCSLSPSPCATFHAKLILKTDLTTSNRFLCENIYIYIVQKTFHAPPTNPVVQCRGPSLSLTREIHACHIRSTVAASHWIPASAVCDLALHQFTPHGCMVAWVSCVPSNFSLQVHHSFGACITPDFVLFDFLLFFFSKKKKKGCICVCVCLQYNLNNK